MSAVTDRKRTASSHRRGGSWPAIAAPVPLLVLPLLGDQPQHYVWATTAALWGLWVISLNIVWGYAGLLSLAQLSLGSVAAYCAAILTASAGVPLAGAVALGMALAVAASIVLGVVSTRLQGFYFAIATIAFALTVKTCVVNWDEAGRTAGLPFMRSELPVVSLGGLELVPATFQGFFVLIALTFVIVNASAVGLRGSRAGQAMRSVRDDPQLARSLGISPPAVRTLAFAISGLLAGVAGILQAWSFQIIVPELYSIDQALTAVMLLVLAGLGSVWAPTVAGIVYVVLYEIVPVDGELRTGILGLAVIAIILLRPGGLIGLGTALRRVRPDRAARARPATEGRAA